MYEKRKIPSFRGDILKFPYWLQEMKEIVAPMHTEQEMIGILDELTPDTINLRTNDTLDQCWVDLTNRYANPSAIVSKVVKEYLDFKPQSHWNSQLRLVKLEAMVTNTYKSLKVVDRLTQLTQVDRMLTHAMECLPDQFRDQVINLLYLNSLQPQRLEDFDVFYSFIKDKKISIEKFSGQILDDLLQEKPKQNSSDRYCKKCNKRHAGSCNYVEVNHQSYQKESPKSDDQSPKDLSLIHI